MKKLSIFIIITIFLSNIVYSKTTSQDLPNVAVVITGGTIVEKNDPTTGASVPAKGEDIVNAIPELKKLANIKVVEFSNIDSSQMSPQIWAKLSKKVNSLLSDRSIAGVIVVHGTDTMAEGSYFLDLTIDSKKPVVFTGAMKNSSDPYSDGPPNLINAVAQVLSPDAQDWGVTVSLNEFINSARDVEKTNTTNPQAFTSNEKGYLGYVVNQKIYRLNNRLYHEYFPIPDRLPNIEIFTDYAGANGSVIKYMVDNGAEGIVVESLGAGNVNKDVFEGIKYALQKNIPVIITTRTLFGGAFPLYGDEGGGMTLKREGAILSTFLNGPKARLLLMITLPKYGNNKEKFEELFQTP